jgi:hypothetical protein
MIIFKFIKADQFFSKYCPQIKSYKHKIRGMNGRGNPVKFSKQELREIKNGLRQLVKDIIKTGYP